MYDDDEPLDLVSSRKRMLIDAVAITKNTSVFANELCDDQQMQNLQGFLTIQFDAITNVITTLKTDSIDDDAVEIGTKTCQSACEKKIHRHGKICRSEIGIGCKSRESVESDSHFAISHACDSGLCDC